MNVKLKFYKNLFLDEDIINKKSDISIDDIIHQLNTGTEIYNLKLICVSKKQNHILEVLSTKELFKNTQTLNSGIKNNKNNKNNKSIECIEYIVVGVAYGKKNAFELVRCIFESYIVSGKDLISMKRNFLDNK